MTIRTEHGPYGNLNMATALPTTTDIEKRHATELSGFRSTIDDIRKMPLTDLNRLAVEEFDAQCKRFLANSDAEYKHVNAPYLEAGRRLRDLFKRINATPEEGRLVAKQFIARHQLERQRKLDEERRKALEQARAQAAMAKANEAQDYIDQAAEAEQRGDAVEAAALLEEAERVEAAPVVVAVPVVEERKLDTRAAVIQKKVGTLTGPIALLSYLMDKPDLLMECVEFKMGAINRVLNRGIDLPGVEVHIESQVSNRG